MAERCPTCAQVTDPELATRADRSNLPNPEMLTENLARIERLRAENERLREALVLALDYLTGRRPYADRKDAIAEARAALREVSTQQPDEQESLL